MKNITFGLYMLLLSATPSLAVNDVMNIPNKEGLVVFTHKKHADSLANCKYCHDKAPGKIPGFYTRDKAHKSCKGCHETKMAGPRKCAECHKK